MEEEPKRVNMIFPKWLYEAIEEYGKRKGMNVPTVVRALCADGLERDAQTRAAKSNPPGEF